MSRNRLFKERTSTAISLLSVLGMIIVALFFSSVPIGTYFVNRFSYFLTVIPVGVFVIVFILSNIFLIKNRKNNIKSKKTDFEKWEE